MTTTILYHVITKLSPRKLINDGPLSCDNFTPFGKKANRSSCCSDFVEILFHVVMAGNDRGVTTGIGFPDVRYKERKEQAVAFYKENKIPETLEKMLNVMYLARPKDLYGYMVGKCVTTKEPEVLMFVIEGNSSIGVL